MKNLRAATALEIESGNHKIFYGLKISNTLKRNGKTYIFPFFMF